MGTLISTRRDKHPQPQVVEDLPTGLAQHHITTILVKPTNKPQSIAQPLRHTLYQLRKNKTKRGDEVKTL